MADVEVEIEGMQELEQKLQALGPKLAQDVILQAIQAGGSVLKQALEEFAPIGPPTDPHQGALEGSIEMLTELEILKDSVVITVGPDARAFWGYFSEFGTVKEPARPWARPAFDSSKQKALDTFMEVVESRLADLEFET